MLNEADVIDIDRKGGSTRTFLNINHGNNVDILVISKERYLVQQEPIDPKILNDRKIIEIAQDMKIEYNDKLVFLTEDVMCRLRAISLGVPSESYSIIDETDIILYNEFDITDTDFELKVSYSVQEIVEEFCVYPFGLKLIDNGKQQLYYKVSNMYQLVDEEDNKKQNVKPKNIGQHILNSLMLDPTYDIVAVNAAAGSGKTILALGAAMRLLDTHKDKYDKIIYIRKTVVSDDQELGFLPGTLEEKLSGYLGPLYSNLEEIVNTKYKNRKTKLNKEETTEAIEGLIKQYNIEVKYEGHLRGDNIRNAVLIIDELQNNSSASLKTILTRVDDDTKVFCIGSTTQIDNKFVSKSNNALTYILSRVYDDNDNVRLCGMELKKIERSRIAEWADKF